MTDREDAVVLADDIEIYGLQNDEERGWFLSSEGERLIVSALRAYAAEPVTPAALRKKIAAAIRSYAPQENADAAFRVIHDGGFVLVPREPTEAMVEAASMALAGWLGLSWAGLCDDDPMKRGFPDWATNGIGRLHMQGGKPGVRRAAYTVLRTAIAAAEKETWR